MAISKDFKVTYSKPSDSNTDESDSTEPQETQVSQVKTEIYPCEQAFRIFKKNNPKAESWNFAALKVFVRKRFPLTNATLDQWFNYFNQY